MAGSRHQLLDDALAMSQRMAALGDDGDWEAVIALEPQRRGLLEQAFATHAPVRPNLIGISTCQIISVTGTTIHIDAIDARNGTPVIDIKCYVPDTLNPSAVRVPDWIFCPCSFKVTTRRYWKASF